MSKNCFELLWPKQMCHLIKPSLIDCIHLRGGCVLRYPNLKKVLSEGQQTSQEFRMMPQNFTCVFFKIVKVHLSFIVFRSLKLNFTTAFPLFPVRIIYSIGAVSK